MNIDPAAVHALTGSTAAPVSAATPPRPKDSRKQDEISPSPLREFSLASVDEPSQITETSSDILSTPGPFILGDKREQGPTKKACKASVIKAQDITKFFTRKTSRPTESVKQPDTPEPSTMVYTSNMESAPDDEAVDATVSTALAVIATESIQPELLVDKRSTSSESTAPHLPSTLQFPAQITPLETSAASTNTPVNATTTESPKTNNRNDQDSAFTVDAAAMGSCLNVPSSPPPNSRIPSDVAAEDLPPLSRVKLVPITKSPYKRTPRSARRAVAFSPTNEVRILDNEEPASCVSVTNNISSPSLDSPLPAHHTFKTVFEISVRINPNIELVQAELSVKLLKTLAFIQQWIDPTAAFLPKSDHTDAQPIQNKASYPSVIYLLASAYFSFNASNWFTKSQERGKQVRLSAILGLNKDPSEIELARADINAFGVTLVIKPHQDVDTSSRLIFLGAPNSTSKKYAKSIMDTVFTTVEAEIMKEDPDYDRTLFTGSLPDYAVIVNQPQGLPYVEQAKGERYVFPARERRALHIMCTKNDYDRLATLTMMAKGKGLWLSHFGLCYPTETPDMDTPDDELTRYVRMVECHQSAQMCYDSIPLTGLHRADELYTLRKDDGSTAEVSVQKILSLIELYDSNQDKFCKVFLCTVQHDDKRFHAYYPGGNSFFRAYIEAFKKCPGPQIYHYLLKRRFLPQDVGTFIRKTFSVSQQSLCATAKYNKRTRMAYVPGSTGGMDMVDAAMAAGSMIDPYLGLPHDRIKVLQAEVYSGPEHGAPDYFDFEDGQSVTTVKDKSQHFASKALMASDIDLRSVYELDGSVVGLEDANEDDLGDEDEDMEEVSMDISLLTGDLSKETPTDTVAVAASAATEELANLAIELGGTGTDTPPSATAIGDYSDDVDVDLGTNFARQLEMMTSGYTEMIAVLESLISEVVEIDPENARIIREQHSNIPDSLRIQLEEDTDGSREMMQDYLRTMKTGIAHAEEIDNYVLPTDSDPEGTDYIDDHIMTLDNTVDEATASSMKPQGCDALLPHSTTRTSTALVTKSDNAAASRLGADRE